MEGQVGPSSKLQQSLKEVKKFMKEATEDFVVLGVFKDETDPMYVTFLEANNDLRDDYVFGHTFDQKAKSLLGVKESCILVIHPSHLISSYEPKFREFKVSDNLFLLNHTKQSRKRLPLYS